MSCHAPHDQKYRDVEGTPLAGRFNDKQCTSCHASKAEDAPAHTKHKAASTTCVSCHMPSRQEPETRPAIVRYAADRVVPYTRSDHTIAIPRPALDAVLGLVTACATCHTGMSTAQQEQQIRFWWGEIKPIPTVVAAQLQAATQQSESTATALLLGETGASDAHMFARFAGVGRFLETYVRADAGVDAHVERRLRELARSSDDDIRAASLAALHLARGNDRSTRRALAASLDRESDHDAALRSRWAVALGYMGDRYAANGNLADAVVAYTRASEIRPSSARLWLSRANAQRGAGDLANAIDSYQRSVALDRYDPLAWVNFGIALGAAGDTTAAITALTNAATLNPQEPLAWFNLGNIALVRGELDRAANLYHRTAILDPSIALAQFQLARVALIRKDYPAALANLRRGLAFDSSDASVRTMGQELARRLGTGAAKP